MKKININYIKAISFSVLFTFSSCDDYLDRLPLGEVADLNELGVSGFESQLFGVYSMTRNSGVGQWQRYWFGSIRSDDAAKGSTATDSQANGSVFDDFDYVAANGLSTSWWNSHYELIFESNEIINLINAEAEPTEFDYIVESEARTFRAWMYFELRRDYGEVPIITATIDNPEDAFAAKSTVAEIDAFILEDLEYALQHLPETWPEYPGRITSGFANALMAKVYMHQNNWEQMYTNAKT